MQDGFGMRSVREDMGPPKGLPEGSKVGILILNPDEVRAKREEMIQRWQAVFGQ